MAFEQLDALLDLGVNFIDTAEMMLGDTFYSGDFGAIFFGVDRAKELQHFIILYLIKSNNATLNSGKERFCDNKIHGPL